MNTAMHTTHRAILVVTLMVLAQSAFAQNYKCKSANGRIEYSDIPCASNTDELSKPRGAATTSKPLAVPMQQLEKLIKEYEKRLCEREQVATEIDIANRAGEISKNAAAWRARQDHLSNLNESLVEFQGKASKITRPTGNDSAESAALRKFQAGLKDCAKIASQP